jgi:hypothetical protein
MPNTSRQQRRHTITIATNLYPAYEHLCKVYGVNPKDASVIFNLCLDTTFKLLQELAKQQESDNGILQTKADT